MENKKLIIYLDILGFKKLISSNMEKLECIIDYLNKGLRAIKEQGFPSIEVDWISDSILITLNYKEFELSLNKKVSGTYNKDSTHEKENPFWIGYFQVIATIHLMSILMINPLRGFITIGEVIRKDGVDSGSKVIFGTGLLKAHEAEQQIASPIILIDSELIKIINDSQSQLKPKDSRIVKTTYYEYSNPKSRKYLISKEGHIIDFTQVTTDRLDDLSKLPYVHTTWSKIAEKSKGSDKQKWKWIRNFIDKTINNELIVAIGFKKSIEGTYFNT